MSAENKQTMILKLSSEESLMVSADEARGAIEVSLQYGNSKRLPLCFVEKATDGLRIGAYIKAEEEPEFYLNYKKLSGEEMAA